MQDCYVHMHFLRISEVLAGQRIDNFLFVYLKNVPKSMIYRIIRTGKIRINKKRVKFCYRLCSGDLLKIPSIQHIKVHQFPIYSNKKLIYLKNTIIYEDSYLLILNKPSGISVHHGSGIKFNIIDGLRNILYPNTQFLELVHRLDRGTSGILIVAKNRFVLSYLQEQWNFEKVQKEYLAVVYGIWNMYTHSISVPLLKKKMLHNRYVNNMVFVNSEKGKFSKTYFQTKEYFKKLATLLLIKPVTGRTHQIRVHTQYAKHPIIGDYIYGNNQINMQFQKIGLDRLFLHAFRVCFIHPITKKIMQVYAPLDKSFYNCLCFLRKM